MGMNKMTKTQTATLAKLREIAVSGRVDVSYGGIKGVHRSALWSLEGAGVISIQRTTDEATGYTTIIATVA